MAQARICFKCTSGCFKNKNVCKYYSTTSQKGKPTESEVCKYGFTCGGTRIYGAAPNGRNGNNGGGKVKRFRESITKLWK